MAGQEKHVFVNGTPIPSSEALIKSLRPSPHLVSGLPILEGQVAQSGVVIWEGDSLIGALRSSQLIPRVIDYKHMKVEYGGSQTYEQVEGVMAREVGMTRVAESARMLLDSIRTYGLAYANRRFAGFGSVGSESERWYITSKGKPFELPFAQQDELHSNLGETDVGIAVHPREQAKRLALDALHAAGMFPDTILNTTSMYMLGDPWELGLNRGALAPYVAAMERRLYNSMFDPVDARVRAVWNDVARGLGRANFDDLKRTVGDLRMLTFAASHSSLGLDHFAYRDRPENRYVSLEASTAVASLFNSDLATVAEMMTMSTPIVHDVAPTMGVMGKKKNLRDTRAVMRLAVHTAQPSPTVPDVESFKQVSTRAIVKGVADRVGRSGQIANVNGAEVATAHGRVRHRIEHSSVYSPSNKDTGRVEFVAGGATPDIVALVCRNAFLQLLGVAAYEALSKGKYPVEYFAGNFPRLTTWAAQTELSFHYNTSGAEHPSVRNLIEEAHRFVSYICQQYPDAQDMQYIGTLAHYGLHRLTRGAQARHLKDYKESDGGTVAEVIQKMREDGISTLDISKAVHDYQLAQAKRLLDADGDILELCMPGKQRRRI